MRIKVECETRHEAFPLEYRRKFVSFLKSAFENYDQDLFSALYGGGHAPKPFCFSIYFLPEVKVSKDGVTLYSKRFIASFTTPDVLLGVHLVNALMGCINKWLPLADSDNELKILTLTKMPEYTVSTHAIPFKILSPIVIRDHDENEGRDWYLTFEDQEFENIWKRNLKTELQHSYNRDVFSDIDAMRFKPILLKKTVVLNYGIYIPCTVGKFVLEGEKHVLEYIYKAGMGSRRGLGFGCLDIL